MAHISEHRTRSVPETWGDVGEHLRKIAQGVNSALSGETNNHYTVTLEADATQTELSAPRARPGVVPVLQPLSAAAAAAMASGTVYATAEQGKVLIHHGSDPSSERVFGVVIVG